MRILLLLLAVLTAQQATPAPSPPGPTPYTVVLGIAQDAGAPQAGCDQDCCRDRWSNPDARRHVACLAIVDPDTNERWLIDATPDFREQLRTLDEIAPPDRGPPPHLAGILLTHAHIGHYTGLMFVGHESMGAKNVPVYAMPRMRTFLATQGPWDLLVRRGNIDVRGLAADTPTQLNERITVTPIVVPHRDEYSETVGFRIDGPSRSILYIPDIDKWERWDRTIESVLAEVDVAYLDGTFYDAAELPGRDMTQIPHPFIVESLSRFAPLSARERAKVRFIHLNHTNLALRDDSDAWRAIHAAGCRVAAEGDRIDL